MSAILKNERNISKRFVLASSTISGFPSGSDGKVSACNAGDPGSIPGSGRSLGEGNGNPFRYSCLGNPMDGGAWWPTVHGVAKNWTRLNDFTFTFHLLFLESCLQQGSDAIWRYASLLSGYGPVVLYKTPFSLLKVYKSLKINLLFFHSSLFSKPLGTTAI